MMRTFQQQRNYERMEQLPPQVHILAGLGLRQVWQTLSDFLHLPSREPQVHQKTDRSGNVYWQVYDSFLDSTLRFDTKEDVMVWLDEQHYRRFQPNMWNFG